MTSWDDVDDHGEPELRRAWKMAPEDPPLVVGPSVDLPVDLAVGLEDAVPQ